ncbi:MAG: Crotonobetainyl-CoA:carnitine CoA-transferase CaiB-like acyl-CoA transferase [Ilumatobacteraceae bacterium]|nr:Crotonobetainyl-CoA:carnitine CoA-transferase CaiB-like acyl-CoA transferase [Ilumatobacteraceae bacterium]
MHVVPTASSMLAPYRVLDLTDGRAELATFVLAGFGADVVKVEPPGGSPSRGEGPLAAGEATALASLRFHAYNRGKRSVVLDLDSPDERVRFLDLVASADFVFENAGPGVMDARGLGFAALRRARPDLVYVALSPFGQEGPYAQHLATDLTLAAMGGAMALNGEPDRRPVRITVPQTWHHAAVESALGAMVAHERRLLTGEAQFVDVSVQAAVFWTGLQAMIAHAIQGRNIERNGTVLQLSTLVTPLVYPCADGEVCLIATSSTLVRMMPWMIASGAVTPAWAAAEDWPSYEVRMLTGESLVHTAEEMRAAVTAFTMLHHKMELFDGGIARGITLAPVNTVADVLTLEQLQVREYWDELRLPSGRTLCAAGPFVKASGAPIAWTRPAPDIGEHTDDVLGSLVPAEPSTWDAGDRRHSVPAAPRRPLPLEGVKVADFSWIGVGPITAKALADHGATVVHVENDRPADRLRLVGPFKDDIAGINRCQFFGSFNTSKLSLQLDLKHPVGNDVAKQLLGWCDIALDSFTAGTMAHLGLGYDVARGLNPDIIMATTCLLGQYGPAAKLAGYGYHAAAVSGFYEITGWDDRPPAGPFNAYTDTVAPRFLTTALLAALDHRRRTGEGQFIDQAQMESALHFLGPELMDVQVSGVSARRAGNEDPLHAPHDAFPCLGVDQWCAIAVETDEQWRALRRALGEPAWAMDVALDTAAGRLAHIDLIDGELGEFTARHEPRELMSMLQGWGVPAGMVQRSSDHLQDPQLAHRAFFRRLEHPEMGEIPYEGHQFSILDYDNGPRFPAPCLGEHTYEVLTEVLGMDDDEVARVMASGACG